MPRGSSRPQGRRGAIFSGSFDQSAIGDASERRRERLLEWSTDPWLFLRGTDVDDRPIIWTKDEGDDKTPYKPFPDKPHPLYLTRDLFGPEKVVLVDKSRQMMVFLIEADVSKELLAS